ncbi:MAG: exonuclease domain-containing protein, partial [Myxococcota bacterium]
MTAPNLVWMDLEMTGLEPKKCAIVQMAIIITDTELNQLAQPLDIVSRTESGCQITMSS